MEGVDSPAISLTTLSDDIPAIGEIVYIDLQPSKNNELPVLAINLLHSISKSKWNELKGYLSCNGQF